MPTSGVSRPRSRSWSCTWRSCPGCSAPGGRGASRRAPWTQWCTFGSCLSFWADWSGCRFRPRVWRPFGLWHHWNSSLLVFLCRCSIWLRSLMPSSSTYRVRNSKVFSYSYQNQVRASSFRNKSKLQLC